MPSGVSYLKEKEEIVSALNRLEMTSLAVESFPNFEVSDMEIKREGNTYTVDTLRELRESYPEYEFYFILGADSLMAFSSWKNPEEIAKLCTLATVVRDDVDEKLLSMKKSELETDLGANIVLVPFEKMMISSSEIRARLGQGLSVDDFLPEKVVEYIQNHFLYTQDDYLKVLETSIQKVQTSKRFTHTLGVVTAVKKLADAYEVSLQKAKIAALLHDCAKCIPLVEQRKLCADYGVVCTELEQSTDALMHSKLGAALAREKYGVFDEDILNAIRNHTTGRPEMSMLEKIIFVADFIEEGRTNIPNLEKIRALAFEDINQAIVEILENTLSYLKNNGSVIDEQSKRTLTYYKECKN